VVTHLDHVCVEAWAIVCQITSFLLDALTRTRLRASDNIPFFLIAQSPVRRPK
jgi:hypothetical protein